MAASFGVRAETVDGLDDAFGEALARHVADPGPSVLVARTPEPLVPPPNTSPNWYRRRRHGADLAGDRQIVSVDRRAARRELARSARPAAKASRRSEA